MLLVMVQAVLGYAEQSKKQELRRITSSFNSHVDQLGRQLTRSLSSLSSISLSSLSSVPELTDIDTVPDPDGSLALALALGEASLTLAEDCLAVTEAATSLPSIVRGVFWMLRSLVLLGYRVLYWGCRIVYWLVCLVALPFILALRTIEYLLFVFWVQAMVFRAVLLAVLCVLLFLLYKYGHVAGWSAPDWWASGPMGVGLARIQTKFDELYPTIFAKGMEIFAKAQGMEIFAKAR